jgi:SAM-dependent methyltransferase
MTHQLSFDRAADFYDETRDLEPAARARLTEVLLKEVAGKQTLEVGIGTGLVGLALARRGVSMCGVDLSTRMLERLAGKFSRPDEVLLKQGDATDLPHEDDSFDAVLASQVLHLIDEWRVALRELARVVRPTGTILIDLGNEPDSGWGGPWSEVATKFWEFACPEGRRQPEVWRAGVVESELAALGFAGRPLEKVTTSESLSLADVISRLERGLWSACWALPDDQVRAAAARTRDWAADHYPDLHDRQVVRRVVSWRAYEAAAPVRA